MPFVKVIIPKPKLREEPCDDTMAAFIREAPEDEIETGLTAEFDEEGAPF